MTDASPCANKYQYNTLTRQRVHGVGQDSRRDVSQVVGILMAELKRGHLAWLNILCAALLTHAKERHPCEKPNQH